MATGCLVYDITFDLPRLMVRVEIGVSGGLAIGLRDGKAVDARPLTPKGNHFEIAFEMRRVDRVLLYVFEKATSIRVCYGEVIAAEEEMGWQQAELIARGVQLPFRQVNSHLPTYAR